MLSVKKYIFFIVLSIALTFWHGAEIIRHIRLVDLKIILFCIFFMLYFLEKPIKLRKNIIVLISAGLFAAVLIVFVNLLLGYSPTSIGLMLFGKSLIYFLFLIAYMSIIKDCDGGRIRLIYIIYLTVFLALACWSLFYVSAYSLFFDGWHPRPSFPFIKETHFSDAHLLGSYLAISLIFFVGSINRFFVGRQSTVLIPMIFLLGLASVASTGSRSGMFSVLLACMLFGVRLLVKPTWSNYRYAFFFVAMLPLMVIMVPGFMHEFLARSVSFSLAAGSEKSRIEWLIYALDHSESYLYLGGKALVFSKHLYFDGIVTFLLYNFGFFGPPAFIIGLFYAVARYLQSGKLSYLIVVVSMFGLIASEYFLIGRWFVPVVTYYCLALWMEFRKNVCTVH